MEGGFRLGAVSLATFLAFAAPAGAQLLEPWRDEQVQDVEQFSSWDRALVLDAAGDPHLFYGGERLYHSWPTNQGWQQEFADPEARSGSNAVAARDASGALHVLHGKWVWDPIVGVLWPWHTTNRSGEWRSEPIPRAVGLPPYDPEAPEEIRGRTVDAAGNGYLLYLLWDGLYLAFSGPGGWVAERVSPQFGVSFMTGVTIPNRVAVDGLLRPHVLWTAGSHDLVHSVRTASGWEHHRFDDDLGADMQLDVERAAIAATPDGAAHVVFTVRPAWPATGASQTWYATNASGTWQLESMPGPLDELSLAIDGTGKAHVAGVVDSPSSTFLDLTYGSNRLGPWTYSTVQADVVQGVHPSIAASATGEPHIAAMLTSSAGPGRVNLEMAHFRRDELDAWIKMEVSHGGPVDDARLPLYPSPSYGGDARIALGPDGERHLAYREDVLGPGERTLLVVEDGDGWRPEAVPDLILPPLPDTLALAVTPDGVEHLVFSDHRLQYARRSGASWVQEQIIGTPSVSTTRRPALAFDAELRPHVLFTLGNELHLARKSDGAWTHEKIADLQTPAPNHGETAPNFRALALAVDAAGADHVAYLDTPLRNVFYVTNASGEWVKTRVGPGPGTPTWGWHDLAVEVDGTVHLAVTTRGCNGQCERGLEYGSNRCRGEWRIELVDDDVFNPTQGVLFGFVRPRLALDAFREPHISYMQEWTGTLRYVAAAAGRWEPVAVTVEPGTGYESDIAVGEDGTVSIVYQHAMRAEARIATARAAHPPAWDGCPILPDPGEILDGAYHLVIPHGALPLYDPGGDFATAHGATSVAYRVESGVSGKLRVGGMADADGDGTDDTLVFGKGRVVTKRGMIRSSRALKLADFYTHLPPAAKLRLSRTETIDPRTRERAVIETLRGRIDGAKVKLERRSIDQVPLEAFGLALELQIEPTGGSGLAVRATWRTRDGMLAFLGGTGSWSPASSSATLSLKGDGNAARIELHGVRVWRSEADGIHLRADSIEVRALGQRVSADLSSVWE